MSIEVNELIVNATIDENRASPGRQIDGDPVEALEELKAQIISDCRDLFHELLDKQRER